MRGGAVAGVQGFRGGRGKGVSCLDAMYGVSMGGASVIRFLATQDISVGKAVVDAGITPYPYPKWICRLIAAKD